MFLSVFSFFLISVSATFAADYYVSPSGNDGNPGTLEQPFRTVSGNVWRLKAGDNMILRGGTYQGDKIYLTGQTGTAQNPITFKAHTGEKPILNNSYTPSTGAGAAVSLNSSNNYIVLDGISIHNVYGHFVYMDRSHHVTIKNCEFKNADGNWMGVYLNYVSYFTMQNCVLDEVSDNTNNQNVNMIHVEGSHHNLFENLTITRATHSLIDFQNSYNNIVRNNILHNDWQKNSGMAAPYSNDTGRNLYENNRIFGARPALTLPGKGAMGLYVNQSSNIIRRNVFYDNQNFGILMDANNAFANSHINFNKVYNNTFYNNGYLQGYYNSSNFTITDFNNNWNMGNNVFKNNVSMDGTSQNIYIQSRVNSGFDGNIVTGNCFYNPSRPNSMIDVNGIGENSLTWFQSNHSSNVFGNTETNPSFVSSANADFTFNTNSGCIDKGVALTTTRSQGSGTVVPVSDAGYFTDGMGLISGDLIRVGTQEATITSIDYTNNNLTVNKSLTWSSNTPVNLPYAGNAPDPGAHESGFTATPLPTFTSVPTSTPTPTASPTPVDNGDYSKLIPVTVVASSFETSNGPDNTVDGNLNTRWSACGIGETITYDLGSVKTVSHTNIAFYLAATQIAKFDIAVSTDNTNWTKVYSGQSGTVTLGLQKFDYEDISARYVRIVGNGNLTTDSTCWNSYTEVENYGLSTSSSPTPSSTVVPTSSPITSSVSSMYSTFDSQNSLQSPLLGGAWTLSGASLSSGKVGSGLSCTASGHRAVVATNNHLNKSKGTVEFWFRPNWNHTDNVNHGIFSDDTGAINFTKSAANELRFYMSQGNTFPEVKITSANYSFSSGSWYKIKLQWDDQAEKTHQLRVFINGTEPTHTDGSDDLDSTKYNFGTNMVLCSSTSNTNATIDEFRASLNVVEWKTGDANEDGVVDGKDYVKWINNYGDTTGSRLFGGDFNEDTLVDGKDYVAWINNYLR